MIYLKLIIAFILTTTDRLEAFNINDLSQSHKEFLLTDSNVNLIITAFKLSQRKCFTNKTILKVSQIKYQLANQRINELLQKELSQLLNRIQLVTTKTDLNNLIVKLKYYDLIRNDPDESDRLYYKLELERLKQSILKVLDSSKLLISDLLAESVLKETTINDFYQKNFTVPFDANKMSNLIQQIDTFHATFDHKCSNENYFPSNNNKSKLFNEFNQFVSAHKELNSYVLKSKGLNNEKIISLLNDLNLDGQQTKRFIYKILKQFTSDQMIHRTNDESARLIHKTSETINRYYESVELSLFVDYEFKRVRDKLNQRIANELNDYILSIAKLDTRIDLTPLRKDLIEEKFTYYDSLVIGSDLNRSLSRLEMSVITADLDHLLRNALLSEKIALVQVVQEIDAALCDLTKHELLKRIYAATNAKHWLKYSKETHDYVAQFFSYSSRVYKQSFNQTLFDELTQRIDAFYQLFDDGFVSPAEVARVFHDFIESESRFYDLFVKESLFDDAIKMTLLSRKQMNQLKSLRTGANIFFMILKRDSFH